MVVDLTVALAHFGMDCAVNAIVMQAIERVDRSSNSLLAVASTHLMAMTMPLRHRFHVLNFFDL